MDRSRKQGVLISSLIFISVVSLLWFRLTSADPTLEVDRKLSDDFSSNAETVQSSERTDGKVRARRLSQAGEPQHELERLRVDKENFFNTNYKRVTPIEDGIIVSNSLDVPIVQYWVQEILSENQVKKRRGLKVFESAAMHAVGSGGKYGYITYLESDGLGYLSGEAKELGSQLFRKMQAFEAATTFYSKGMQPSGKAAGKPYASSLSAPVKYPDDPLTRGMISEFLSRLQNPASREVSLSVLNLITYNIHSGESIEWWINDFSSLETGPINNDSEK